MAKKIKYRLQVLLDLKFRAKRKAEVELARAIKALEEEKEQLKELEDEKKEIEAKIENEQQEMRDKVATGEAVMKDPQYHLNFIRKLKDDLEDCENRIEKQKEAIKRAEKKLQRCRTGYIIAAQELNVMEQHKELWHKKQKQILTKQDEKMMNELGNTIHQMNQFRNQAG